jgi:hypothetical protein
MEPAILGKSCAARSRPSRTGRAGASAAHLPHSALQSRSRWFETHLRPPEKARSGRMLMLIRRVAGITAGTTRACSGAWERGPAVGPASLSINRGAPGTGIRCHWYCRGPHACEPDGWRAAGGGPGDRRGTGRRPGWRSFPGRGAVRGSGRGRHQDAEAAPLAAAGVGGCRAAPAASLMMVLGALVVSVAVTTIRVRLGA